MLFFGELFALYQLEEGAGKEREKASHVFWSTTKTPAGRATGIPTLHEKTQTSKCKEFVHSHT